MLALAFFASIPVLQEPAAAQPGDSPERGNWASAELKDHPLAGRVWLGGEGRYVGVQVLVRRMARARFILLGERHDNPDHHRIQAWVTARLVAEGRRPALAMEMFRAGQQRRIDAHLAAHPNDAEGLGAAAGWGESGWPPWEQYAPIVRPVVVRGLPVVAANIDRSTLRAVLKDGLDVLGGDELRRLGLARPLPPPVLDAMDRDIVEAHCGYLDRGRARAFTRIQVLRDARFAAAMTSGPSRADGAVLVAGNGHVRRDRGVPLHLRRRGIERHEVFTLGIVEVVAGRNAPEAYGADYGSAKPPFDAVWFTPRAAREDPCKAFESLKKNK